MPRKYVNAPPVEYFNELRFNEAGADAPEIQHRDRVLVADDNASMRPGRMPRKYAVLLIGTELYERASMRPGRMPRKYSALAIGPVAWSFDRFCE